MTQGWRGYAILVYLWFELFVVGTNLMYGTGSRFNNVASLLIFMGGIMNLSCTYFNGWMMPVKGYRRKTFTHIPMTRKTKLNFFGDWIRVGFGIASVGDLAILAGFGVFVFLLAVKLVVPHL